jgi:hypothetical protein
METEARSDVGNDDLHESTILTEAGHVEALRSFLPGNTFKLKYRASRDGSGPLDFHMACDGRAPTVVLCRSLHGGFIFGGYTSVRWITDGASQTDKKAFLFSIVNPAGLGPTMMPIRKSREGKNAIYTRSSYGPTFGSGHDLKIGAIIGEFKTSSSILGHSYKVPVGQDSCFLTGSSRFAISEVEVYTALTEDDIAYVHWLQTLKFKN